LRLVPNILKFILKLIICLSCNIVSMFNKVIKTISHAPQKVLQRMGMADETVDRDFNTQAEQIKKLDETVKKIIKDIDHYYAAVEYMGKAIEEIGSGFDAFYNNDVSNRFAGSQKVMNTIHEEWLKDRELASQGLIEYQKEIKELRQQISTRNDKLIEFDTVRRKIESLNEKKKKGAGDAADASIKLARVTLFSKSLNF
jgi:predicted Holliday junction resolvase-like endonuclease